MSETHLTEQESLDLIRKMISKARNEYYESGTGAILWGVSNAVCFGLSFLDFGLDLIDFPVSPFLLMIITFILQYYFWKKEIREKNVHSYDDDVNNYAWGAFTISVLIVSILGAFADLGYWTLPILLILFAMPTYISGKIHRFRPFEYGGYVFWLLGGAAMVIPEGIGYRKYVYLLVAVGAVAGWVIPGIILNRRYRMKQKAHV